MPSLEVLGVPVEIDNALARGRIELRRSDGALAAVLTTSDYVEQVHEQLVRRGPGEPELALDVARSSTCAIGCECVRCLLALEAAGSKFARPQLESRARSLAAQVAPDWRDILGRSLI